MILDGALGQPLSPSSEKIANQRAAFKLNLKTGLSGVISMVVDLFTNVSINSIPCSNPTRVGYYCESI